MTTKSTKKWYLVGRGFNGWHAGGINVTSSGGNLDYVKDAVDGALVYDAKHLEDIKEAADAFAELVISGPMVNPALPRDGVDRFSIGHREVAKRMLPGLGGAFKTLAEMVQDSKFSGLDMVGLDIYESMLRQIPRIKIGHVHNGEVVWEPND